MIVYTTYGQFQREMNEYYKRTGSKLQFPEMMRRMHKKGLLEKVPPRINVPDEAMIIDDEEFDKIIDTIPIDFEIETTLDTEVVEERMIPQFYDVFTIRHPRFTRQFSHTHNYFELNFVIKGTANFFEQ